MNKSSEKSPLRVIGIDLGKNSFQLCGVNELGQIQLDKKLTRKQLKTQMVQIRPCLVGMEAYLCVYASNRCTNI